MNGVFSQLKDAALTTLKIQKVALKIWNDTLKTAALIIFNSIEEDPF